jgi:methionyl aminopeptidase
MSGKNQIPIKTPTEIDVLRRTGKILASIVRELTCSLKSGMTTAQVDALAENIMAQRRVKPAFKGYRGYPANSCISVNQEVVHGIPGERVIRDGDIVSIDVGIISEDFFSDMAVTVGVGKIAKENQTLLDVTREALVRGIAQATTENHLSDISFAIQSFVEANHFTVVRDYVGHGIGRALHEPPEIPNFGPPHCGPVLKAGMVLAIEPMVNRGTWQTKILDNGWTVETMDGCPSAHFEHSIAVTESGPLILTA